MRNKPRTLLIGGTQAGSGKSLLSLAFATVLVERTLTVTIVHCHADTVTWTKIGAGRTRHQWQTNIQTAAEQADFWEALQFVHTDYLLIDLSTSDRDQQKETWLMNQCWLPLVDDVLLVYAATADWNQRQFQDLGSLQFSMEYTGRHPKIYTVANAYGDHGDSVMTTARLLTWQRDFQAQHREFAALDLEPLGWLRDAQQAPAQILTDARQLLAKVMVPS